MKKTLVITLVDGRRLTSDLEKEASKLPIGSNANHQFYAGLCDFIGAHGWPEEGDSKYLKVIPPSQIKLLEVFFLVNGEDPIALSENYANQ